MSDNYLQNKNKITARKWYTDMDLNITPHPSSGDLVLKQDKEAVKRSVRNIMLTNNYERPFKPNFGANLRGLLFELAALMRIWEIGNLGGGLPQIPAACGSPTPDPSSMRIPEKHKMIPK